MKKLIIAALMAVLAIPASAQFEQGKAYVNTSLSGLSLSYSKSENFCLGLGVMGGYFFADSWMAYGRLDYQHQYAEVGSDRNDISIGVGARYYIVQNGLYLNLGLQYEHRGASINNFLVCPEVGYTFFLNRHVTLEPSIYYNMSCNNFADYSKVGLRVGFGYFF